MPDILNDVPDGAAEDAIPLTTTLIENRPIPVVFKICFAAMSIQLVVSTAA